MRKRKWFAAIGALALSLSVLGSAFAENSSELNKGLAEVRQATTKYHDINVAIEDGYVPVGECVEVPGLGAMGIHYLNFGLLGDGELDANSPEVLLYIPNEDGKLKLAGVEYVVSVEEWLEADNSVDTPPTFFGQTFEGPMDGHGPGEPEHFDKHVWIWEENPSGMFAQFNPNLTCGNHDHEQHEH
jgi:hypothetical protein